MCTLKEVRVGWSNAGSVSLTVPSVQTAYRCNRLTWPRGDDYPSDIRDLGCGACGLILVTTARKLVWKAGMLFRFSSGHRMVGWLLTLVGLVALALGGRGYWTGASVRPAWVVSGLIGIVVGTALVRWARRARPD